MRYRARTGIAAVLLTGVALSAVLIDLNAQVAAQTAVPGARTSGPTTDPAAIASGQKRARGGRPLVDGRTARGSRNISSAWFSGPTDRYRHYVLGSDHEPESLWVADARERRFQITLGPDAVFEDREPRIVDLDGDGQDEIVVIKSTRQQGAALAVAALTPEGLRIVAETTPVGRPFRWLNPAGFADFDGDGALDIALVEAPHVGGTLQLWTWRDGRLVMTLESDPGFASNHVARSGELGLSAVADFDGDGIADLAIPTFDRRSLQVLSFKGGRIRELHTAFLPGPAVSDFRIVEKNGRTSVEVGLAGGRKAIVTP